MFRNGVEHSLKTLQGCTAYHGHGRFVAPNKVAVNNSELTANQIFINVGARAAIPPIPGVGQVPYLTNSSMMEVDYLTSHLVIAGRQLCRTRVRSGVSSLRERGDGVEMAGPARSSREDADVSEADRGHLERARASPCA